MKRCILTRNYNGNTNSMRTLLIQITSDPEKIQRWLNGSCKLTKTCLIGRIHKSKLTKKGVKEKYHCSCLSNIYHLSTFKSPLKLHWLLSAHSPWRA